MNIRLKQTSAVLDSDVETPISLFLRLAGQGEGILLESAEVGGRWGRYSVIAADFLLCLACREGRLALDIRRDSLAGLTAFEDAPFMEGLRGVMRAVSIEAAPGNGNGGEAFPPITRALFGYFGYGAAGLMEPKLAPLLRPEEAEVCLALPGSLILFDHAYNRVCALRLDAEAADILAPGAAAPAPAPPVVLGRIRASMTKEEYLDIAAGLREQIRQGEAIQVVPSVRFEAPFAGEPFTAYRRLRRINPSPYMFFMRLPGITLLGSSPEVMVGCAGGRLRLCPIAGTRPRGREEREDNLFEEELAGDPKEQAEHVMLVDLGRNDLGRVAVPGSVALERYMEVERFSHVMHLTSHIGADLVPGRDALDVLAATFPAGTVSGAPKIRAMELIAGAEPCPRGPYAGAIGWFGLDRDAVHMDTGITIRSLWVRDGKAHWQAGGGVVYDSSPEAEWREINHKAASALAALGGQDGHRVCTPEAASEQTPHTPAQGGEHVSADR